jgi:hypothetical protein
MRRREKKPLPFGTPKEYIGRDAAIEAIQTAAKANFMNRMTIGHIHFNFLVASGHVRSGKTRSGIETPRLVEEICSELSTKKDRNGTHVTFAPPVYLLVDFLNGSKFNNTLDPGNWDPSVSLGARLMFAFYQHDHLKPTRHDYALKHIIETVISETSSTNESVIVPIVIHFDEHGQFIAAINECKSAITSGKRFFEDMLKCLGSAATSDDNALSHLKSKGRFFLVPITTGTSRKDATFSQVSTYGVKFVPLPLLSMSDAQKLAKAFLTSNNVNNDVLDDVVFQIALSDCGRLPGIIGLLCQNIEIANKSYVHFLHDRVKDTIAAIPGWNHRWKALSTIFLARVKLRVEDFIEDEYMLR